MSAKRSARLLCLLVCLVVVGTLSGCAPSDSRPIANPIPQVVWPEGEPTGPLESDPWVQALREYALVTGAARLSLNYSDPALLNVMSEEYLLRWYPTARESTRAPLGPVTFVPVEVNPTSSATVEVVVCPNYVFESIDGSTHMSRYGDPAVMFRMELGADGFRRVYDSSVQDSVVSLPGSLREGQLGSCYGGGWTALIKPAMFTPPVDQEAWRAKVTEAIYNTSEAHYVPPLGVEWVDPGSFQGWWQVTWADHQGWWVLAFLVIAVGVITVAVLAGVHIYDRRRASPPKGRAGVTENDSDRADE